MSFDLVYVAVGLKTSTVSEMISGLARTKDMSSVVVVLSGADEASTLQFLAPYTGATVAEYFMYQGTATCSVYDDLTTLECLSSSEGHQQGEAYPQETSSTYTLDYMSRAAKLIHSVVGQGDLQRVIPCWHPRR